MMSYQLAGFAGCGVAKKMKVTKVEISPENFFNLISFVAFVQELRTLTLTCTIG